MFSYVQNNNRLWCLLFLYLRDVSCFNMAYPFFFCGFMKSLKSHFLLCAGLCLMGAGETRGQSLSSPDTVQRTETLRAPNPKKSFGSWLKIFKDSVVATGISQRTADRLLPDNLTADPHVLKLDRNQPGGKKSKLSEYLAKRVPPELVAQGVALLRKHRPLLERISAQYGGVPPEMIVAAWGVESSYSNIPKTYLFELPRSLATLAHDRRRSKLFSKELTALLKISDAGDIPLKSLTGSWAGATGGPQFMPSTILAYAVDGDADGKVDIWNNPADIFASVAHYLSELGWEKGKPWGHKVVLTQALDSLDYGHDRPRQPLIHWHLRGVVMPDGSMLKSEDFSDSTTVIQPDGPGKQAYLLNKNFYKIREWNKSNYFVVSMGTLSDKIKKQDSLPRKIPQLKVGKR